ncbi:coenzyme F420-0:L-glutamate ligase [Novosphingobium mangrovi (ex Huang et al. 2023)]|uniref:Coenzyme F420-0:L-glutamate ligase n=1 Tax=Novosphingobium mangrovi (ex Huang et al. 2023) TaxID=2976432 RepID=A0ABT2I8D1_9SPHN|nr:coenzyme F420-0:L-glutamate ligase [Novosphingobium mangrovi (ex Huang et al. 2023)]MCT2401048.1 coenzyme F420-0:L-glutamate ligase [Novosphingobium mangrovi (ex Huang et al. 2023)]
MFAPGMSIAQAICTVLRGEGDDLRDGDICVIAQKIVSKVEGRAVELDAFTPGTEAEELARLTDREPTMAQAILDESAEILRATPAAIVARHRSGHVLANAGIDASNVEGAEDGTVLLWPRDPDASARAIRTELQKATGIKPGVVIADSMGRAWRIGTVGTAIGCAGLTVLEDRRGRAQDLFGRTLQATVIAVADSIAAMGTLAMGEGAEGTPVALVRGAGRWVGAEDGPGAASGLRPMEQDMFR